MCLLSCYPAFLCLPGRLPASWMRCRIIACLPCLQLGWDTAVRIVMPKYYGGSETGMVLVFRDIQHAGCSFLVAGRVDDKGDGQFKGLQDIALPAEVAGLFAGIPEDKFRSDISSTALRAAGQGL